MPQSAVEETPIGKIVSSSSHADYVCQVYGRREIPRVPQPDEYALGSFLGIRLEEGAWRGGRLVGVVYNTMLVNPDFGSLGPRLSPRADLGVVSPDLYDETATLVGLLAIGWQSNTGEWTQGAPRVTALVNNSVHLLDDDAVTALHKDAQGRLSMRYLPLLLVLAGPLAHPLVLTICDRLRLLFPESRRQIDVIRSQVAWKSIVQPAG